MVPEDAFMQVLQNYYDMYVWQYRQKVDEYRDMKNDPETTPEELAEVRQERIISAAKRNVVKWILAGIEDDVRDLLQQDAMSH